MTPKERQDLMRKADTFYELMSLICKDEKGHESYLKEWEESLERFFDNNGFSRAKPKKMAVTYIITRFEYSATSVSYFWGDAESSYWSISKETAQKYLREIKELINQHPEADTETLWSSGDAVYETNKDPMKEFYGVDVKTENSQLTAYC